MPPLPPAPPPLPVLFKKTCPSTMIAPPFLIFQIRAMAENIMIALFFPSKSGTKYVLQVVQKNSEFEL